MKSTRTLIRLLRADGSTMAVEAADRLTLYLQQAGTWGEQRACAAMLYEQSMAPVVPIVPFDALGFGTRSTWLQRAADHLNES